MNEDILVKLQNTEQAYSILFKEDGVFLVVNPDESIDKSQLTTRINEKIIRKGITNVFRQAVVNAIDSANGEPVKIADSQVEKNLDASVNIMIAQDRMSASLVLLPPEGGKALTLGDLQKIIRSRSIIYGIDENLIAELSNNPKYDENIVFAVGQQAVRGEDGRIEFLFETNTNRRPTILEDGSVDFHELHYVTEVKKGQALANIIPPKQGISGKNVLGMVLPAINGRPAVVPRGKNTELANNGTNLIASIDGQISYTDGKINILTIFEVPGNVDISTGNIHFTGNVVVKGNVLTDFVIEATGTVEVHGVVEGATIKAGGDIIIKRGVQGLHKGLIISGHDIVAKYIEHCTVVAKNDIKSEAIMHCDVKCGNIIELGGKKGLIVGGSVKVAKEIRAKVVGSQMATVTDIEVGVDPTLRERYHEVKELLKGYEPELGKTEQAIALLNKMKAAGGLKPDKQEMLNKLLRTKIQLNAEIPKLKEEYLQLEEELSTHIDAKIKVQDIVYSGTKITIGSVSKYIKEDMQYATFHVEGAEIKTLPYER